MGVTCVHPGGIKTGIARNGRVTDGETLDQPSPAPSTRSWPRPRPSGPPRSSSRPSCATSRGMLVGADAHALHTFAKLTGARYQDVVVGSASEPA